MEFMAATPTMSLPGVPVAHPLRPDGEHAVCPRRASRAFKRYEITNRHTSWTCTACGHHVHPTAGTIFHKSSTSLHLWFYAMYIMASTRCGISAKQLERELGVTYKTAWRMFHLIRNQLMTQDDDRALGRGRGRRDLRRWQAARRGDAAWLAPSGGDKHEDSRCSAWSSVVAACRAHGRERQGTTLRAAHAEAHPARLDGLHRRVAGYRTWTATGYDAPTASTTPRASTCAATSTRTPSRASGLW